MSNPTGAKDADTAELQEEGMDADDFTDTDDTGKEAKKATDTDGKTGEQGGKGGSDGGADKGAQDADAKAKNAEEARKRREREIQERIDKAVKEALGKQSADSELEYVKTYIKTNKFTKEKINDREDLETYKTMLEMEEKGLDPIEDYAKYVTGKRKAERAESESRKRGEDEYFKLDTDMLVEAYGVAEAKKILEDEKFMTYFEKISEERKDKGRISILAAKAKYDRENAADAEKKRNEEAAKLAKEKVARALANDGTSTGRVGSDSPDGDEYYTIEQIKGMSEKDIIKNWEKVKKSYQRQK